jgi:hypothetical protein
MNTFDASTARWMTVTLRLAVAAVLSALRLNTVSRGDRKKACEMAANTISNHVSDVIRLAMVPDGSELTYERGHWHNADLRNLFKGMLEEHRLASKYHHDRPGYCASLADGVAVATVGGIHLAMTGQWIASTSHWSDSECSLCGVVAAMTRDILRVIEADEDVRIPDFNTPPTMADQLVGLV